MTCIAIIPARAGSKGIPGKNTALINGKSLVQLAIESAQSIPEITRVVVTSDDISVQNIAQDLGAEVIVRPVELAQDNSPIEAAILHALAELCFDPTSTDAHDRDSDAACASKALRTDIRRDAGGALALQDAAASSTNRCMFCKQGGVVQEVSRAAA